MNCEIDWSFGACLGVNSDALCKVKSVCSCVKRSYDISLGRFVIRLRKERMSVIESCLGFVSSDSWQLSEWSIIVSSSLRISSSFLSGHQACVASFFVSFFGGILVALHGGRMGVMVPNIQS